LAKNVRRNELGKFLEECLLPHLGRDWRVYENRSLVRLHRCVIQSIGIYRFANRTRFRVHGSLQLTIVPADGLHSTIGDTLKDEGKSKWFRRTSRSQREAEFDWASRIESAQLLMDLARDQIRPPVQQALSVRSALVEISRIAERSQHSTVLWSLAMLRALDGNLVDAARILSSVRKRFEEGIARNREIGRETSQWKADASDRLAEAIGAMVDRDRFVEYCEVVHRRTLTALDLDGIEGSDLILD